MILGANWFQAANVTSMDFATSVMTFPDGSSCHWLDIRQEANQGIVVAFAPKAFVPPNEMCTCSACGTAFPWLCKCSVCGGAR